MDLEEDANKGWLEKYLARANKGETFQIPLCLSHPLSLCLFLCFFVSLFL